METIGWKIREGRPWPIPSAIWLHSHARKLIANIMIYDCPRVGGEWVKWNEQKEKKKQEKFTKLSFLFYHFAKCIMQFWNSIHKLLANQQFYWNHTTSPFDYKYKCLMAKRTHPKHHIISMVSLLNHTNGKIWKHSAEFNSITATNLITSSFLPLFSTIWYHCLVLIWFILTAFHFNLIR